jgi:hypothetical protein
MDEETYQRLKTIIEKVVTDCGGMPTAVWVDLAVMEVAAVQGSAPPK